MDRALWGEPGMYDGLVVVVGDLSDLVKKLDKKLDTLGAARDEKIDKLEAKFDRLREARDERERQAEKARIERERRAEIARKARDDKRDRQVNLLIGFVPVFCILVSALIAWLT